MKIIGITLKNYKCYQGTTFVKLSDGDSNFHGIIGENGVGKSAILQGLNSFFTQDYWIRNKISKKGESECGIGLIVRINENAMKAPLKDSLKQIIIWSDKIQKSLGKIVREKDYLYLGVIVYQNGKININLGGQQIQDDEDISSQIYTYIKSELNYIYIDAEINIDSTVGINSETVSLIKGGSVSKEIANVLSKEREGGKTIIDEINDLVIHHFDDTIVAKLKEIDTGYNYKNITPGAKSTLNKITLAELAVQAVFTNRGLVKKRGGKDISLSDMSSGQRRSALLDFLIAVVSSLDNSAKGKLILGIDEPEISVGASSRIQQFQKIQILSESLNSIFFTTHWYGWVQQISVGGLTLIDEQNERKSTYYDINSSMSGVNKPPFQLRMIFDFITSLGEWAELDASKKFIIVEGPTDKIYINKHFEADYYKILTARGGSILTLINIFKTFSWRGDSEPSNLRILIDTDLREVDNIKTAMEFSCTRRISRNDSDGIINIVKNNNNLAYKASIEDLLSPEPFLKSLNENVDKLTAPDDVNFINNLTIKYADKTGIWSFGLDQVGTAHFYNLFKGKYKESVAISYNPSSSEKLMFQELFNIFS